MSKSANTKVNARDVINAHRIFFGQKPNDTLVNGVVASCAERDNDLVDVLKLFASSKEFHQRLHDITIDPLSVNNRMSQVEFQEIMRWSEDRFPFFSRGTLTEIDSPASFIVKLLHIPDVTHAIYESISEKSRDIRVDVLSAWPLHNRIANANDASCVGKIFFGKPFHLGKKPITLYTLLSSIIKNDAFLNNIIYPMLKSQTLLAFMLRGEDLNECAEWLSRTFGVNALRTGALISSILTVPAVDEIMQRHWNRYHIGTSNVLPALTSGAYQLNALTTMGVDVEMSSKVIMGEKPNLSASFSNDQPLLNLINTLTGSIVFYENFLKKAEQDLESIPQLGLEFSSWDNVNEWIISRLGVLNLSDTQRSKHPLALIARALSVPVIQERLDEIYDETWRDVWTKLRPWLTPDYLSEFSKQQGEKGIVENKNNPIPKQVDAPIITAVANHKLIRRPGRNIPKTAPIAGMSKYLAEQFTKLAISLEMANTDKRFCDVFWEAKELLDNWSISNLLAFGSHLYLLETCANDLRRELADPTSRRMDATLLASQKFINSFEEWRAYEEISFSAEENLEYSRTTAKVVSDAADILSDETEVIDPSIPSSLQDLAKAATNPNSKKARMLAVISAIRSIKNIAISFAGYVGKAIRTGYENRERALTLLRVICRLQPHIEILAALHAELSWLRGRGPELRAFCDMLGKEKKS